VNQKPAASSFIAEYGGSKLPRSFGNCQSNYRASYPRGPLSNINLRESLRFYTTELTLVAYNTATISTDNMNTICVMWRTKACSAISHLLLVQVLYCIGVTFCRSYLMSYYHSVFKFRTTKTCTSVITLISWDVQENVGDCIICIAYISQPNTAWTLMETILASANAFSAPLVCHFLKQKRGLNLIKTCWYDFHELQLVVTNHHSLGYKLLHAAQYSIFLNATHCDRKKGHGKFFFKILKTKVKFFYLRDLAQMLKIEIICFLESS